MDKDIIKLTTKKYIDKTKLKYKPIVFLIENNNI